MSLYSRLDRIAADVEKLNRQVTAVANAPQSQRTSVEGGSIDFNDSDGNLKAIIGMQDDGGYTTNVVSGPTPPTPANFTVEVDYGKIVVHWDGSFGDALVAPTDWARAEVYAQEGQFVTPSRELARGSMVAASGGEVTVGVLKGQWTVCMAGWSQAGIMSPMSAPVTVDVPGYGDLVQETLDEAQELIDEAKAALEAGQADLAEKITDAESALASLQSTLDNLDETTLPALRSDLDAAEGRLSSAEGQITDAFGRIVDAEDTLGQVPGKIDNAKDAAINTAASDATQKAIDALADARLYADQQDALTLSAAEQAAQDKADAAQAAAEAKAADAQQTADDALAAINAGESMWLDPGFETSNGPFESLRAESVRSGEQAYQGAWSMKISTDGDSGNQYPGEVFANVTPGRVYRLSAAVRSDDSLPFTSWVHEYDGATLVGSAPFLEIATSPGGWFLGNVIRTIPQGVNRVRFIPMIPGNANTATGKALYLDNFKLTDITSGYEQYQEALQAATDAQRAAGEAKAIAEAAVGAAEGGNTNFYSSSEPSGVGSLTGDLWYQVNATGGTLGLWYWDGSNWRKQTFNNEVFGDISANKITFGTMHGDRIQAGSLTIGATAGLGDELDSKETPAQAQARADAAQAAAEASAASDATQKANSAKSDAITAAASDATAKANNAAASAVSTAAANANAQYGETKSLVSGWRRTGTTKIDGGTIATGTVYADSIISGLSQNMVPDPGFVNEEINAARMSRAYAAGADISIQGGVITFDATGGVTDNPNVSLVATSDLYAWAAYPGMRVVARVSARVEGSARFRMNIRYRERSGATRYVMMSPGDHRPSGAWQDYTSSFTLPQEATGYSIVVQAMNDIKGILYVRSPFASATVGTTIIEPGAVTTDRLAANVLEVGNLKAGTAAIAEAVVQKIAASTASIQQADVKNLFVTGTSSLSDVVAERIASETAKFIQLEVGNLVAGTGTMDTATVNKLFSDVVVASMAQAQEFIGENAILTGAVTAPKITASEELWAKIAEFVKIRAEHIESDAIDGMVITGATIRSAATGARTLMSASGFEAYDNTGKRTFFASASTGNVSMTGELYTGEPGSERVVLDNSLWNSVEVVDPDTNQVYYTGGSGVRVGVNSSSGVDIYHATRTVSDGRFLDSAIIRGPGGRTSTRYGMLGAGGGNPASNYVISSVSDNSGVLAAHVNSTVGGSGDFTRKTEIGGYDSSGRFRAGVAASGGGAFAVSYAHDAGGVEGASLVANGTDHRASVIGRDSSGGVGAQVVSYGSIGRTVISGTSINPFVVSYSGSSSNWYSEFRKGSESWGMIGCPGALGSNEFGIMSDAGKSLRLQDWNGANIQVTTSGSERRIISTTISESTYSGSANMYVSGGGGLGRIGSSLRYKTDVEDADDAPTVLDVQPKTWVDRSEKKLWDQAQTERERIGEGPLPKTFQEAEDPRRYYGAIAEEVHDLGLTHLVGYDEYGRPDTLNYDRFAIALIPEVRKLRDRITELERLTNE